MYAKHIINEKMICEYSLWVMNGFGFLIDKVRRFKVKGKNTLITLGWLYSYLNFVFKETKEIKTLEAYFKNHNHSLQVCFGYQSHQHYFKLQSIGYSLCSYSIVSYNLYDWIYIILIFAKKAMTTMQVHWWQFWFLYFTRLINVYNLK